MSDTEAIAEFTSDLSLADVPDSVVARSKLAIRDLVGVALYGSRHPAGERITSYVETAAPGDGATVLGRSTASPAGAALANGTFGHAIDYDDTFESMVLHPTAPIFPAALAATEHVDGSSEDLLTGYISGVEVAFRVGHSIYPGHYDSGWHNTGTVGTFGATAAAASVLGLDAPAVTRAFGIAASCSSSLKKNFGSMTKPLHPGHAAQMGIRAAFLAEGGFTADEAIFEDELGYCSVMNPNGEYDPTALTTNLGEQWGVSDIGFKPYPSGVITHAAMEALRSLVVTEDLTPENVTRIMVTLEEAADEMLIHADPRDELQAKFSIEFCLAAILRERNVGVAEFSDEYVTAPATREAMRLVERVFEPDLFGGSFAGYGARVVVKTTNGTEHVAEEQRAPGSPSNPLPEERWTAKFTECATAVLDGQDAERVADAIDRFGEAGALQEFLRAVRTA